MPLLPIQQAYGLVIRLVLIELNILGVNLAE